jgi:hypothetical protein
VEARANSGRELEQPRDFVKPLPDAGQRNPQPARLFVAGIAAFTLPRS